MSDFKHLSESTRALMTLPASERACHMITDRFLTHERLAPILATVEFLRFCPPQSRASGLVVSGPPGSGKTMIARAIQRRYAPQPPADGKAATRPVLAINMTGAKEAKVLYNRMLHALGVPDTNRYSGNDRERMVMKLCRAADVRLLVLDEVQDVLSATPRQQRIAFDTIKFMMNEMSLPILALGTSKAPEAMMIDEHLNARFTFMTLPVWRQDQFLVNFLDALEPALPLAKPSHLSSLPMTAALIRLSGGILHKIVRLVTYAAAYAVESGEEQVTPALLEKAAVQPPAVAVAMAKQRVELARQQAAA